MNVESIITTIKTFQHRTLADCLWCNKVASAYCNLTATVAIWWSRAEISGFSTFCSKQEEAIICKWSKSFQPIGKRHIRYNRNKTFASRGDVAIPRVSVSSVKLIRWWKPSITRSLLAMSQRPIRCSVGDSLVSHVVLPLGSSVPRGEDLKLKSWKMAPWSWQRTQPDYHSGLIRSGMRWNALEPEWPCCTAALTGFQSSVLVAELKRRRMFVRANKYRWCWHCTKSSAHSESLLANTGSNLLG